MFSILLLVLKNILCKIHFRIWNAEIQQEFYFVSYLSDLFIKFSGEKPNIWTVIIMSNIIKWKQEKNAKTTKIKPTLVIVY